MTVSPTAALAVSIDGGGVVACACRAGPTDLVRVVAGLPCEHRHSTDKRRSHLISAHPINLSPSIASQPVLRRRGSSAAIGGDAVDHAAMHATEWQRL